MLLPNVNMKVGLKLEGETFGEMGNCAMNLNYICKTMEGQSKMEECVRVELTTES